MGRKNRKQSRVKFCGPSCLCMEDETYHSKMKQLSQELAADWNNWDFEDEPDEWGYGPNGDIIDLR